MSGGLGIMEMFLILTTLFLWIFALIDVLRSSFEENIKLPWFLAILFGSIFGAILYLTIGRKQRKLNN